MADDTLNLSQTGGPPSGHESLEYISQEPIEETNDIKYFFMLATTIPGTTTVGKVRKVYVTTPKFGVLFKPEILHDVEPGFGPVSDIFRVNDSLGFAAFKNGSVAAIKDFHPRDNFECDVRGHLQHKENITRMSKSASGGHIACASEDGSFSVFDVDAERMTFSYQQTANNCHTDTIGDIQFLSQTSGLILADCATHAAQGCDHLLSTVSRDGLARFWDVRLAARMSFSIRALLKLTCISGLSDTTKVVMGTETGDGLIYDMRRSAEPLMRTKLTKNSIYRVREIKFQHSGDSIHHTLVMCSNQSKDLIFRNPSTMMDLSRHWKKVKSGGSLASSITDFRLVGQDIVTCGYKRQMGCFAFIASPPAVERRWTSPQ